MKESKCCDGASFGFRRRKPNTLTKSNPENGSTGNLSGEVSDSEAAPVMAKYVSSRGIMDQSNVAVSSAMKSRAGKMCVL